MSLGGSCSGFIFMCNGITKPECYRHRVFGLPRSQLHVVKAIKPGTSLFLYDFDLKLLYGLYQATSSGDLDLEPSAFSGKFPAQIRFHISQDCLPLHHSVFRTAIIDNYVGNKFKQDLSLLQLNNLLSLFRPLPPSPPPPDPHFYSQPSRIEYEFHKPAQVQYQAPTNVSQSSYTAHEPYCPENVYPVNPLRATSSTSVYHVNPFSSTNVYPANPLYTPGASNMVYAANPLYTPGATNGMYPANPLYTPGATNGMYAANPHHTSDATNGVYAADLRHTSGATNGVYAANPPHYTSSTTNGVYAANPPNYTTNGVYAANPPHYTSSTTNVVYGANPLLHSSEAMNVNVNVPYYSLPGTNPPYY